MSNPLSALDHNPEEFIREVSTEAITFYVDELSGLHLPEEFIDTYGTIYEVKRWEPQDRLKGKFGRLAIKTGIEDDAKNEFEEILVMGTSIGLQGLDRYSEMHSLRHYMFRDTADSMLSKRGRSERGYTIGIDYGSTRLVLNEDGTVGSIMIGGKSADYGRADTEGRYATCKLFAKLLGDEIEVINADPEPSGYDQIIRNPSTSKTQ